MPVRPLLAAALIAATVASTRADAQPARVGVYLGSSIATIASDEGPIVSEAVLGFEQKRRIGLQGGLWLNKPLSGSLSLQPELHFTHKGLGFSGSADEPGEGPTDFDLSLNLSYAELPVLLRADFGQADGGVRPFVLAGPVVSYQISCSIEASIATFSTSRDCNEDLDADEQINKLDVGAALGGGLAFRLSGREVTAGLRYTHGLRSLSRQGESATNQNFSVLFGLGF
jgi:hypothetical protein